MNQPQFQQINHPSGIVGAVASRIGGRAENQDSFLVSDTPLGLLVAVCDGMGGGPAGKTASMLAAQALADTLAGAEPGMDPADVLRVAVKNANKAVTDATVERPELRGMGTTCVAVLVNSGKGYVVHVGDSRCYQIRGKKMEFRTTDHSYVAELVRRGTLTEEDARNSDFSNVITRAIGASEKVEPEVDIVRVAPRDRFALMSDGIWGALPEDALVAALAEDDDVADIVAELAVSVDRIGENKGGGHDNLTLALIELPGVETVGGPMGDVPPTPPAPGWETDDSDGEYSIEDDLEANAADAAVRAAAAAEEAAKAAEEARQAAAAANAAKNGGGVPPSVSVTPAASAPAAPQLAAGGMTLAEKVAAQQRRASAGKGPDLKQRPAAEAEDSSAAAPPNKGAGKKVNNSKGNKWRPLFWVAATALIGVVGYTVWANFLKPKNEDGVIVTTIDSSFLENGQLVDDAGNPVAPDAGGSSGTSKPDSRHRDVNPGQGSADPQYSREEAAPETQEAMKKIQERGKNAPDSESLKYLKECVAKLKEMNHKIHYKEGERNKEGKLTKEGKQAKERIQKERNSKYEDIKKIMDGAIKNESDLQKQKEMKKIYGDMKSCNAAAIDNNYGQPTETAEGYLTDFIKRIEILLK